MNTNANTFLYEFFNLLFFIFYFNRCKKWIQNSGLTDLYKIPIELLHMKRLCRDHFKPNQFCKDAPSLLKPRAVPTRFDYNEV